MYDLRVLTAEFISNKMMQSAPVSLNTISHDAAIDMIDCAVNRGLKLSHVIPKT